MLRALGSSALFILVSVGACSSDDDDASGGGSSGSAGTPNLALGGTGGRGEPVSSSAGQSQRTNDAGAGGETSPNTAGSSGTSSGGSTFYLPCASASDCAQFGGGKVCCVQAGMHFCTKPSACSGDTLP